MSREQDGRVTRYGVATAERPSNIDTFENNRWVRTWDDATYRDTVEERKAPEKRYENEKDKTTVVPLKEEIVKNLGLYQKETAIKLDKVINDKEDAKCKIMCVQVIRAVIYFLLFLTFLNDATVNSLELDCKAIHHTSKYECVELVYAISGNITSIGKVNLTVTDVPPGMNNYYNSSARFISAPFLTDKNVSKTSLFLYNEMRGMMYNYRIIVIFFLMSCAVFVFMSSKYFSLKLEIYDEKESEFRRVLNMKTEADKKVDALFSSFKEYLAKGHNIPS